MSSDPIVLSAARWFWWIAGLSLVNTVLFYSGADLSFVVGLGITTLANVFFADKLAIAVVITAAVIGFYFFIGLEAQREKLWAYYLGLLVYAFDGLIYVYFKDWMSVGFHALAIYFIVQGVMRLRATASTAA
jgi:uncharacterized membrane protein SirB2